MALNGGMMSGGRGGPRGGSGGFFPGGGSGLSGGGFPGGGGFPMPTSTPGTQVPAQTTPPATQPLKPTSTSGGVNGGGTGAGNQGTVISTTLSTGGGGSNNGNAAPDKGNTPGGNSPVGSSQAAPPLPLITTTKDGKLVTLSLSVSNGGTVVVTITPSASPTHLGIAVASERNRTPVGLVVGVLFAGIFVTLSIIFAVLCFKRRKRRKDPVGIAAFTSASEEHKDSPPPIEECASYPSANSNSAASIAGSDMLLLPNEPSADTSKGTRSTPSLQPFSPQNRELQLSDHDRDIDAGYNPPRYASMYDNSDSESVNFNPVRNIATSFAESSDMYTPPVGAWAATSQVERSSLIDHQLQPNR